MNNFVVTFIFILPLIGCTVQKSNTAPDDHSQQLIPIQGTFSTGGSLCGLSSKWLEFNEHSVFQRFNRGTPVEALGPTNIKLDEVSGMLTISMATKINKAKAPPGTKSATWKLIIDRITEDEFRVKDEEMTILFNSGKRMEYDGREFGDAPRNYKRCRT